MTPRIFSSRRGLRRSRTALATLGLLLCAGSLIPSAAGAAEGRDQVLLRTATLSNADAARGADLAPGLRASAAETMVIIKYGAPVSQAQRLALEERASIYSYLPHDAFLVRSHSGAGLLSQLPPGALWASPLHPGWKLAPELSNLATNAAARATDETVPVLLTFSREALQASAVAGASRFGSVVGAAETSRGLRVRVLAHPSQLAPQLDALARLPELIWAAPEGRRVLLNDTTSYIGQTGPSGGTATPLHDAGLLGQGQVVAVLDTGIDPDMCYFREASGALPPVNACDGGTLFDDSRRKLIAVNFLWSGDCNGGIGSNEWDNHDHGTHVAGTVAGDNLANVGTRDSGDGMAPAAQLVIQDGGIQFDNCADLPGLGCPVVDLEPIFQQTYDQGARIHTNSWGDRENFSPQNLYSAGSEDADAFMREHPDFLLVFAAGNSGPSSQTVGSPATAKNVLAVGATLRAGGSNSMASFSSCGPTDDGRIKPDLTNPGSSIQSANSDNNTGSNNCNQRSMSGTSMAAPGAAGFAALARQYFTAGYYPSGVASPLQAFTPSAALVKAVLVHSASDMSGAGPVPDNCQGWGRLQLAEALYLPGDDRALWVKDATPGFLDGSTGQTYTYRFQVEAGEALKITLGWTDAPSTPAASTHLVQDLDLSVRAPGSSSFQGNVFSAGSSTAGGSADRVNNLEQIYLPTPSAGVYEVDVHAFNLPDGAQPYSLVVTGDAQALPAVEVFGNGFETGNTDNWSTLFP
ncbi:MAG: S8 family serine peptidase [Acidobacteriota bacterium]